MALKDILKQVGQGALGIVSGGVSDKVFQFLETQGMSDQTKAELALLREKNAAEVRKIEIESEARMLESVNATMRVEAQSGGWMQRNWRPTVGFTFCAILINNYIFLPYFQHLGAMPITIPGEVWSALLVVLGVAAGTRGLEKWQKARSNGNGE